MIPEKSSSLSLIPPALKNFNIFPGQLAQNSKKNDILPKQITEQQPDYINESEEPLNNLKEETIILKEIKNENQYKLIDYHPAFRAYQQSFKPLNSGKIINLLT